MVLWNIDLLWKTMVLWTKLWYYTENYRTSIYEEKKHGMLPNTKKLWKYSKIIEVLNKLIAYEL